MILSCLLLWGQIWAGYECTRIGLAGNKLGKNIKFAIGITIGIGCSTIIFFFSSTILAISKFHIFIHSIILLASSCYLHFRKNRTKKQFRNLFYNLTDFQKVKKTCFSILQQYSPIIFYFLLFFYIGKQVYFRSPQSLPFALEIHFHEELALEASFHHGCNSGIPNIFKIAHPSYVGLNTPSKWIMALHSAMLHLGGFNLRFSFIIPIALIISSFSAVFISLCMNFGIPFYISVFAPFFALNISGFGFFRILIHERRTNRMNDYVSEEGFGKVTRFHPILHLIYCFRSTAIMLSTSSSLFLILLKYSKTSSISSKKFIGLISGFILPASHHQAFISIALFLTFYSIFSREVKYVLKFYFIGSIIHIPHYSSLSFIRSIFHIQTYWYSLSIHGDLFPALKVWWNNAGLFSVTVFGFSWFFISKKEKQILSSISFVFIILNYWKLQLYSEFNIFGFLPIFNILGTVFFFITLYRSSTFPKESEEKGIIIGFAFIITLSICSSSALGVWRQMHLETKVLNSIDEILSQWIIKNTPKGAVFSAPRTMMNPVSILAGRKVVIEHKDLMKDVYVDISKRESELLDLASNNSQYGFVDYLIQMKPNTKIPLGNWTPIYDAPNFLVYHHNK